MTVFLIEGLDRLGKSTLIKRIQSRLGHHLQFHRQKPDLLSCYMELATQYAYQHIASEIKAEALFLYQTSCFSHDMQIINAVQGTNIGIIYDRSWLGEAVYADMYRGYSGDYVFELEKNHEIDKNPDIKLVLLVEDFATSKHFVDDGESFDIANREREQEKFIAAFNKSCVKNKIMVCVTDKNTGDFRPEVDILKEVLMS